jgi:hypothetical protein
MAGFAFTGLVSAEYGALLPAQIRTKAELFPRERKRAIAASAVKLDIDSLGEQDLALKLRDEFDPYRYIKVHSGIREGVSWMRMERKNDVGVIFRSMSEHGLVHAYLETEYSKVVSPLTDEPPAQGVNVAYCVGKLTTRDELFIPIEAVSHVAPEIEPKGWLWLVSAGARLELWSDAYRLRELAKLNIDFDAAILAHAAARKDPKPG